MTHDEAIALSKIAIINAAPEQELGTFAKEATMIVAVLQALELIKLEEPAITATPWSIITAAIGETAAGRLCGALTDAGFGFYALKGDESPKGPYATKDRRTK